MSMTLAEMEREIERLKALETAVYSGALTWTPAFSSSGASFAYNAQSGQYVRVGKLVFFSFYLSLSGNPGGTTSNAATINLPVNNGGASYALEVPYLYAVTLDATYSGLVGYVSSGSNVLNLTQWKSGAGSTVLKASNLAANSAVGLTGIYLGD